MKRYLAYIGSLIILGNVVSCNKPQTEKDVVVSETYVHKYGVEVPQEDWESRGQHGQVIQTLKSGVVVSQTYNAGVLEGETTYTFPHNETIQKIENYVGGNKNKEVLNYASGKPMQETNYLNADEVEINRWYENGAPLSKEYYAYGKLWKGEYYSPKNQLETRVDDGMGTRITRDEYGIMTSHDTITDGYMTVSTTFHPNGHPKEVTPFNSRGMVEGLRRTYLPAGEPNTIENWVDGRQQGITQVYQNGEKYAEIPYVNGRKNGMERHYRDGQVVVEEITWENDVRQGQTNLYIGDIVKTEWYHKGKPISKQLYDIVNNTPQR